MSRLQPFFGELGMESPLGFRDVVCMVGHIARMLSTAVNVAMSVVRRRRRFHVAVNLSVSHPVCVRTSCSSRDACVK
jgi:hypothetical protein